MTLEKTLRTNVVKALRRAGRDPHPVENMVMAGYPDVEFIGGTMELKSLPAWPKRETTIVRLEHYTREQRVWQERRAAYGGRVWVMLQVGSEFLLFDGATAAQYLGSTTRSTLLGLAKGHWKKRREMMESLPKLV